LAFGPDDVLLIADLPDNVAAAALASAVGASGALKSYQTVALLTAEEMDRAGKMTVDYRPPGRRPSRGRPYAQSGRIASRAIAALNLGYVSSGRGGARTTPPARARTPPGGRQVGAGAASATTGSEVRS